jgi:fibronectin-binding autotransporter adhesin
MKVSIRLRSFLFLATSSLIAVSSHSHAQTSVWTGATNGTWDTSTGNWDTGTYAGGNAVQFRDTGGANLTISVASPVSPASVTFTDTGAGTNAYTFSGSAINGSGALTLNSGFGGTVTLNMANGYTGGTFLNSGTLRVGNLTAFSNGTVTLAGGTFTNTISTTGGASSIANALDVTGTTSVFVSTGNMFLSGPLSGSGTLNTGGSGSGQVAGSLIFTNDLSNFTGTITHANVNNINNTFFDVAVNTTAKFSTSGATSSNRSLGFRNSGTSTIGELSGTGGIVDSTGLLRINQGTNTSFAGLLRNHSGGTLRLEKLGVGTLTLSGTNTYTGATTVTGGVLEAAVLANGSTNSSIGASSNAAANLVFGAPTAILRYTGSSDVTTNRGFTMSSGADGGATIESSGTGTLSFDNTVAIAYGTSGQTRTLTLGGTNTGANTMGKVIANNGAGATSLAKSGTGTWVLNQANTYSGTTSITGGTLSLTGTGSIANSSTIQTNSNTTLNVTGLTGNFTVGSAQTIAGSGSILATGKTVTMNGTLSPGNSPGTLIQDGGIMQLGANANLNWQIHDADGAAGTGYDTVNLINTATLDLTALSALNPYNINLWSLSASGPDANGNAINFNNTLNYAWTLFSTGTPITGFDVSKFAINVGAFNGTTGFSNTLNGTFGVALGDSDTDLMLTYTAIPEPSAALLGGLGMLFLLRRRRN